ncbi:MAG TPA: DctP family TRAP transporter solute-binding subunit [Rectinemataceae bacterium]|nr:DctP family TRAP transporter solute-binding subunit [Rectinemataceae bacterium]
MRKISKVLIYVFAATLMVMPAFAAGNQPTKIVFSTQASADVNYVKAMYMLKEKVESASKGSLLLEIHDNGSLMTQEGEVDAVARGTLDMMFSSPFLISNQLPYLNMFTAAYIFKNQKHMRAVMDGPIGQTVAEDVAKKLNVRWLTALYCGSRNLDMRNIGRDIKTPADLAGVNLRMPNSAAWLFMGRALGANPTPMAFAEVYQGLQTGAIDGQDNPLPTTRAQKWYEVTSSIVLTGHVIEPMCVAINEKKWQSLSADQRQIMTKAIKEITAWNDAANLESEKNDLEFFRSKGLKIITPDVKAFMAATEKAYLSNKQMTKDWDLDLYNKIKNLEY